MLLCAREITGVVSLTTKELNGANVTRGIVPVRFNGDIVNKSFGYYLMTLKYIQDQIKAKTYGAALLQKTIGDLRKIKIAYPTVKEQQKTSSTN